jgi:hypothetical protein
MVRLGPSLRETFFFGPAGITKREREMEQMRAREAESKKL